MHVDTDTFECVYRSSDADVGAMRWMIANAQKVRLPHNSSNAHMHTVLAGAKIECTYWQLLRSGLLPSPMPFTHAVHTLSIVMYVVARRASDGDAAYCDTRSMHKP